MRLVTPSVQEMMPMLQRFHLEAGECGYTLRKSIQMYDQAVRDPFQTIMGAYTDPSPQGPGGFVGFIWVQLTDDYAFLLQAWSDRLLPDSSKATRLLVEYAEQWARSRGAFTIRAGVSRTWLRALEKRYGFVAKQTIVEKRLG